MATNTDSVSQAAEPVRVLYAMGRMLGVQDFQAEQDYHRGRLARVLLQLIGTGTVSGLKAHLNGEADPLKLELRVTAGLCIDGAGRLIDVPYMVCIRLKEFLDRKSDAELSDAFKADAVVVDLFVRFISCGRGKTPSFATMDDYDATDAFVSNRLLDSFGMFLVPRREPDPKVPADPWQPVGDVRSPGSNAVDPTPDAIKQHILDANAGPAVAGAEFPSDPDFDRTAVFLARVSIAATRAAPGARPVFDLAKIDIDNLSRLFVYPSALLSRWAGLSTGRI